LQYKGKESVSVYILKIGKLRYQEAETGSRSNYRTAAKLGTECSFLTLHIDVSVGQRFSFIPLLFPSHPFIL